MSLEQLGYNIFDGGVEELIDQIENEILIGQRQCRWLACMNPHSYAVSKKNRRFFEALNGADWLVPDGIGIVFASKMLGGKIRQRITGFDVFDGIMNRLDIRRGSIFLLGSTDSTLQKLRREVEMRFPNVRIAGMMSPPFSDHFSDAENAKMIDAVNRSQADVLWVAMTAPKQEIWIHQNRSFLSVAFSGAIGAVFDFAAGNVKRSPKIFRSLGLEWLPRLVQEPKRLWRRMAISAPIFLYDVVVKKLRFQSRL